MALVNDVATTTQILQASPVTHNMAIQAASNLVQAAAQVSTATAGAAGSASAATAAAVTTSATASVSSSFTVAAAITSVVAATAAVTVGVTNVLDLNNSTGNSTLQSLITAVPTLTPAEVSTSCTDDNEVFNSIFQIDFSNLNRSLSQQEKYDLESKLKGIYNNITEGGCDDIYNRDARAFDIVNESVRIEDNELITSGSGNIHWSCNRCNNRPFGTQDTSNRQLVQEAEGENEVAVHDLFDNFIKLLIASLDDVFPFDDNVQLSLFSERLDMNSSEPRRIYPVDPVDKNNTSPIPLCDGNVDIYNGNLVLHLGYLDRIPDYDERESLATTIKTIYNDIMGTDNCSNSTNDVSASGDLSQNETNSSAVLNATMSRIKIDDTNNSIAGSDLNILPTVKMLVTSPVICSGCEASFPFFSTTADATCTNNHGDGEKGFTEFITVLKAEMDTIFPTERVEIVYVAEIVQPNDDPFSSQAQTAICANFTSELLSSEQPTQLPSTVPSSFPSQSPSVAVSNTPSKSPSVLPSFKPSIAHSGQPSTDPTDLPTVSPTGAPFTNPSDHPSKSPSINPLESPKPPEDTASPTSPSSVPSLFPSESPSATVSNKPSVSPTVSPVSIPSENPSNRPSRYPSTNPSESPTGSPPSKQASMMPSQSPFASPSGHSSTNPSLIPTMAPTCDPSTLQVVDITENNNTSTCSQQYDGNPIIVKEPMKDYQNEGSNCISLGFNQTLKTNGNLQFVILEFLSRRPAINSLTGSSPPSCLLKQATPPQEILWIDECVQCVDEFAKISVYGRDNNWYLDSDTALIPDRCGSHFDPRTKFSCAWTFHVSCTRTC